MRCRIVHQSSPADVRRGMRGGQKVHQDVSLNLTLHRLQCSIRNMEHPLLAVFLYYFHLVIMLIHLFYQVEQPFAVHL